MKTKLLGAALALGLAVTPLASIAGGVGGGNANSNWTIYGWQNWSLEFGEVDTSSADPSDGGERTRDFQRIQNNAANIGFSASIDTGVSVGGQAVKANFQCEQFTFTNRFNGDGFFGFNDFCNRNSKISLSGIWGEVMFGNWLLPYNEMVAQWVDPFYDAGATSHTSIMGSIGQGTRFFNSGFGFNNAGGFGGITNFGGTFCADGNGDGDVDDAGECNAAIAGGFGNQNNGFNRRQAEVIQWFSPNWNGLTMRIATTDAQTDPGFQYFGGNGDIQVTSATGVDELDPRIWSAGIAYTTDIGANTNIWGALTYEKHDEWAAVDYACEDSDDDSYRVAGRLIQQIGSFGLTLSAMYEDLEYDHENCAFAQGALGGNNKVERDAWMVSGKLDFAGPLDVRFSYMDADDLDCDGGSCNGFTDDDTAADAWNVGLFYNMPAGTELHITYSEVDNDDNASYDYGIGPAGVVAGGDIEHIGLGITQWF